MGKHICTEGNFKPILYLNATEHQELNHDVIIGTKRDELENIFVAKIKNKFHQLQLYDIVWYLHIAGLAGLYDLPHTTGSVITDAIIVQYCKIFPERENQIFIQLLNILAAYNNYGHTTKAYMQKRCAESILVYYHELNNKEGNTLGSRISTGSKLSVCCTGENFEPILSGRTSGHISDNVKIGRCRKCGTVIAIIGDDHSKISILKDEMLIDILQLNGMPKEFNKNPFIPNDKGLLSKDVILQRIKRFPNSRNKVFTELINIFVSYGENKELMKFQFLNTFTLWVSIQSNPLLPVVNSGFDTASYVRAMVIIRQTLEDDIIEPKTTAEELLEKNIKEKLRSTNKAQSKGESRATTSYAIGATTPTRVNDIIEPKTAAEELLEKNIKEKLRSTNKAQSKGESRTTEELLEMAKEAIDLAANQLSIEEINVLLHTIDMQKKDSKNVITKETKGESHTAEELLEIAKDAIDLAKNELSLKENYNNAISLKHLIDVQKFDAEKKENYNNVITKEELKKWNTHIKFMKYNLNLTQDEISSNISQMLFLKMTSMESNDDCIKLKDIDIKHLMEKCKIRAAQIIAVGLAHEKDNVFLISPIII